MKKKFYCGTRASPLAFIQSQIARDAIFSCVSERFEGAEIVIKPLKTSGDWQSGQKEQPLVDAGADKGLFTAEIEQALLSGVIDFAVHSMKDVPIDIPDGLTFAAILKRGDPRDAFISKIAPTLDKLPKGARVGSSSLRRQAQLRALRPDLHVVPFRGNVDTRLRKIEEGEADATLLAVAGLERLGLMDVAASILNFNMMLPAAGQGALGIQIREDDEAARRLIAPANDEATAIRVAAERAVVKALDGSCRAPVAALAQLLPNGRLILDALAAKPDGSCVIREEIQGRAADAEKMGKELGQKLRAKCPSGFFSK